MTTPLNPRTRKDATRKMTMSVSLTVDPELPLVQIALGKVWSWHLGFESCDDLWRHCDLRLDYIPVSHVPYFTYLMHEDS